MTDETKALAFSTAEQSKALVAPDSAAIGVGALMAKSPEVFVSRATAIASALARVIRSQNLSKTIGNSEHVYVEGWTTLAAMLGMTPREVLTTETEGIYVSTYELVNADGRVIARASAECGADDEVDNYGNMTWGDRPRYARRSMAQTRATSKVCRVALSWIMTLAGYAATPAEEMDSVVQRAERNTKGPWDGSETVKFGKFKGKKWLEVPNDYLAWMVDNMKPPALDMAKQEVQRRISPETPDIVEADIVVGSNAP